MKSLLILLVSFIYMHPQLSHAGEYVPVDQLGKGAVRMPLSRHFSRPRQYNPRLYGRIQKNRDPNIGRYVTMPAEFNPVGNGYLAQNAMLVADADPSSSMSSATTGGKVKLFNTVELGRPLSTLPDWLDVIKRNQASPIFQDAKYLDKKKNWGSLKQELTGLSKMDQLRYVNKFWNAWPYKEDIRNWGQEDYWAIPAEFLRKSGDCEDYAIVKYYTLKELGFNPQNMRLVVLRDTVRNLAHAVLAVYINGDAYILDNLSNTVLSHKRLTNYSPQYSVNESGRWAHIKSKSRSR